MAEDQVTEPQAQSAEPLTTAPTTDTPAVPADVPPPVADLAPTAPEWLRDPFSGLDSFQAFLLHDPITVITQAQVRRLDDTRVLIVPASFLHDQVAGDTVQIAEQTYTVVEITEDAGLPALICEAA